MIKLWRRKIFQEREFCNHMSVVFYIKLFYKGCFFYLFMMKVSPLAIKMAQLQ